MREDRQTAAPPELQPQAVQAAHDTRGSSPRDDGWFAAPLIAIVAVVCCAGPLLLAALVASGAGAWLLAHGYVIGAAVLALAAMLAWVIRARLSRG